LGLLIQGSIQPPPGSPGRDDFQRAMQKVAVEQFQVAWDEAKLYRNLTDRAAELARQKYSSIDYNEKR